MFIRTFTHKEFLEYKKKRNKVASIISLVTLLNPVTVKADIDFDVFDKIDNFGDNVIYSLQHGGYYVIAIVAIADIIRRGVIKKDKSSIPSIVIMYLLIYALILLIPLFMKSIGDALK